jgi:hypothetical protein
MIKSKKKEKNRSNLADPQTEPSQWDISLRSNPPSEASDQNPSEAHDPWEDQQQYSPAKTVGEFTPGELGQPDDDKDQLDRLNPQGVQSGRGPLDQEGEGNRQNDELAELQQEVSADSSKRRTS